MTTNLSPRHRMALLGATALALVLAGCSSSAAPAQTPETPGVLGTVETNYGKVEVPAPAEGEELRVVALGWSDGEVALSLGIKPVAIFDWQSHGAENKGVGSWATDGFGDSNVELIERGDESLNYEQIQALDPDVILNVRAAFDDKAYERLSQIAPTVQAPEGTPAYAVNWRDHTSIVATALGKKDEGAALVDTLETKITETQGAHPEFKGVELVSGSKFGDAYGASLPGDARFDMYGDMGFVLDPEVKALPSPDGFFAAISVEQVKALDTEVAVMTTIGLPIEDLKNDELLQSLEVFKDGRAVVLDPKDTVMAGSTAGTVQSISLAMDAVIPQLESAVAKIDSK